LMGLFDLTKAENIGKNKRYCVQNNSIQVCTSSRCAGAIDLVSWNGKQFISDYDHGRELQIAVTVDNTGECYNPTEAGSLTDGASQSSSSKLLGLSTAGNVLRTTSLPAFWMSPGNCQSTCGCAKNTDITSNYKTNKAVTIGVNGVWNAIEFLFDVTIPEEHTNVQIESPTGYHWQEFDTFYRINLQNGQVRPENRCMNCIIENQDPAIVATSDKAYAMGSFIKSAPTGTINYALAYFTGTSEYQTSKWSNVWRTGATNPGTLYGLASYICIGNLDQVIDCMRKMSK